jgi:hypothetical protein
MVIASVIFKTESRQRSEVQVSILTSKKELYYGLWGDFLRWRGLAILEGVNIAVLHLAMLNSHVRRSVLQLQPV